MPVVSLCAANWEGWELCTYLELCPGLHSPCGYYRYRSGALRKEGTDCTGKGTCHLCWAVPLKPSSHVIISSFLPVSLGFFDDILIPPESLQQPAKLYPLKYSLGQVDSPTTVVTLAAL